MLNVHRPYCNNVSKFGGFSGIYLISAFVEENGFEAKAFAGTLHEGKKIVDEYCQGKSVSVIGLYCDYENVTENRFLCSYIKRKYGIPVLVGGPQATALKLEFYLETLCDVVVLGEGELTMLELLRHFVSGNIKLSEIKGIRYFDPDSNELRTTGARPLIKNLDALPFISRHNSLDDTFRRTQASIMTGRGCPFHCAFCYEGHHTVKVRFRSVENVLAEVDEFLAELDGHFGYIMFTDDTFTLDSERVRKLCEGLAERKKKYDFQWFCEGHVHTLFLHPEMLEYMANAGLKRLQLGIEAGTQNVLDYYRKGCTLDEMRFVISKCVELDIEQIFGNIIVGGPHFNLSVFEQDLAFGKELLYLAKGRMELGVVSFWPLPETELTEHADKYGIQIEDNEFLTTSSDFSGVHTADIDIWGITALVNKMNREFRDYMKELLINDKIPLRLVSKWYAENGKCISTGQWFYELTLMKHHYNYYGLLCQFDCKRFFDLDKGKIFEYHPMRVGPLYNFCEKKDDILNVYGETLDKLSMSVIKYSAGKMNVGEIISRLKQEFSSKDEEKFEEKVVDIYSDLAIKHMVVFSEY